MTVRRCVVPAVMIVCLGAVTLAQDEELPLANWGAPPYWNPAVQQRVESEPGRGMVAHAQGMQAHAEALPSSPLPFVAIAPCRIVDTRVPVSDGFHQPNFADGEARTFPFPSSPDCLGLPSTAGAWSLNVQFRPISQLAFLTAYPTGTTRPGVSTLTASPAAWVQNAAVVPAGTGGAIDIYCQYAGRVVIDINGYYGPQSVVTSLTGSGSTLTGDVTLGAGLNVTITPSGNTLTIHAAGMPPGSADYTLRSTGLAWVPSGALLNDGTNIALTGNLNLPPTTATTGQILVEGSPFLHGFGANNTFVGALAGNLTLTGARNTGVGQAALFGDTSGQDNSAVGAGALLANTSGSANSALGSGALEQNTGGTFNTAVGYNSMASNTTARRTTAVGAGALFAQDYDNGGTPWNTDNTAIGWEALNKNKPTTNSNGVQNTALGSAALHENTTGDSNVAVGYASLYANTSGGGNTATGSVSLSANTTGYSNTASGTMSMNNNTTGYRNTVSGYSSMRWNTGGYRNTALGAEASTLNTTGNENTAVGERSLAYNQIGIQNTAVGASSLWLTTGNYNTAIGYQAMRDNTTGGGNVAIGHNSAPGFSGDNQLFIGNGLGTLIWGDFNTKRVAIGMTGGTYQLQLATDSAGKPGGGSWADSSDARLKRDIRPLEGALDRLLALRGVSFAWIHPEEHGGREVERGFIAQDVERVFPEWVRLIEPTGADRELVAPGELVRSFSLPFAFDATLVEALREQQDQIRTQQAEIEALKVRLAENETQQRQIDELRQQVRMLIEERRGTRR